MPFLSFGLSCSKFLRNNSSMHSAEGMLFPQVEVVFAKRCVAARTVLLLGMPEA